MKPRVIIFGGCGFIGRNLVNFLIREDLVEEIRVADKVPPQTAWLSNAHSDSFADPRVNFISANLINPDSYKAVFARDDGAQFDFAVNCACETRPGRSDPVYAEGIFKLSVTCAKESVKAGVRKYVEISTGHMASNKKVAHEEHGTTDPYTIVARWKRRVEEELAGINGLNYVVLRPAIVYGFGDRTGLMPLLVIGSIYKHLDECLKLLWTRELPMNTVNVIDLCRAIWHVLNLSEKSGEVYNVVDDGKTMLGDVANLVSEIHGIDVDFWGSAMSALAKADLETIAEEINDKHLGPWAAMCAASDVSNTPLSPFLDKETLSKNYVNLDGSKLKATGFQYSFPKVTAKALREVLQDYVDRNLFPKFDFS